jgi:hypothetical protein
VRRAPLFVPAAVVAVFAISIAVSLFLARWIKQCDEREADFLAVEEAERIAEEEFDRMWES